MNVELAAKQFEALGSPTRLEVYLILVRAGASGMPVRSLQDEAGIRSASTLSHHLHRLMEAGLASQERRGTTLICRAIHPALQALVSYLAATHGGVGQGVDA
ncbi:ArsR/SmtB family transcription factor [Methylobacterium soli]|uniref:Winged helix-turn-helix transcriptional regulator n=1 Tax=Methylobacterium soli TaxID=553447 RepID=A0A6L3STG9_9HYPH|nr:helix-turn-helix domain-containing protein [Methylobacterium soli]KAB1076742.1 winged helix-turn-helix transcriptional regulator [Methylobacterium soli]GJE45833.1 hypothetical protein AEGHOMDF_5033 [Methylobacterium soli]